jgi:hypothetical protein
LTHEDRNMSIYWVVSYFLKPEKASEYQKWVTSDGAKGVMKRLEMETGFKYINTYFPILGVGDYDAEDWFEVPNWAAADKTWDSKAFGEWNTKTWDTWAQARGFKSRVMRAASDVKVMTPP